MFSLFSLFCLLATAAAHLELFDNRSYICRKQANGMVDCKISFDGNEEWDAINDSGCYQETEPESGSVIEWCPLQCHDSPRAYVTENPSGCEYESFGVLRRKNDWFLWRAEPCDQQETVFRVACARPGMAKKHPKLSMNKTKKIEEVSTKPVTPKPVETNNVEDDNLPLAVDAILGAMFPSYRKTKQ